MLAFITLRFTLEDDSMIHAELKGHYREDGRYPIAVVNVTNHCNLSCEHCFIFRDGNPNEAHFTTPFCCYGNDVDCDRCGAWVVFHLAARFEPASM